MEKKLLSTAIAGVMAATMGVANADTTIFGHLDYSVIAFDEDTGVAKYTSTGGEDDVNMVCTTCSIGVKGSEDLGNGMKVMYKLDFQFDGVNRNANGSITDRDQWLGVGANWGKVRFGTISTGYKSTGAMIDPLYRTVAQGRDHGLQSPLHTGAGEEGQGRMTNHIRYDSPEFGGGFKVIGDYALDSNQTAGAESNDPYALTGLYENGPILAYASYITNDMGGSDDAWKLGGSYAFGDFKVYGQYEADGGLISRRATGNLLAGSSYNNEGRDIWHIGGSYTMGNNMVYAAYGQTDDDDNTATNTESTAWTLAGAHSFSKRTMVYAGYNNEDFDATGEADVFLVGMKHKF